MKPPIRVRAAVQQVPPYRQGRAPKKVGFKLSSNENPWQPPQAVLQAVANRQDINRYTAPDLTRLREAIAEKHGVAAAQVRVGAGSVALLYQLVQATCGPENNYVFAWPSFEAYPLLGAVTAATARRVPVTADGRHDLDAMARRVDAATGAVLLCSPNNPTGPAIHTPEFQRFMRQIPDTTLVVLDEAYAEFVTDAEAVSGTAELLRQHPNLVVLRTFAKAHGLAGLRIGYGIGAATLWEAVQAAAIPMSVSAVAETAALAALTDAVQQEQQGRVAELLLRRKQLLAVVRGCGIAAPEAQGNFVWLPAAEIPAGDVGDESAPGGCGQDPATVLAEFFADRGVLVRAFPGDGVRITVGEAESVTAVQEILEAYLQRQPVRKEAG